MSGAIGLVAFGTVAPWPKWSRHDLTAPTQDGWAVDYRIRRIVTATFLATSD
jgi:hypothetical protein